MEIIGDYELLRQMGRGASATVWHAIHRGWKPCALKVFEGSATDAETRQMFRDEVRTAMSFSHGSIVQVFDAGEHEGKLWMASEWVDGVSLEQFNRILWQRGGMWPTDLAAYVVGRLLVALAYVHEFTIGGKRMHVVHRDVKPGNVLVSAGGEVKLTDFGVAKMWRDDSHSSFRGTFRYVSIEHFKGRATQRSDLFGVGAILHEVLCNKPFRAMHSSPADLYQAILDEGTVELDVDAPVPLAVLHTKLLAPVEKRIASARDAHEILSRWPQYRPGELGLGRFFADVMGRGGRSGVTMHEGLPVPDGPLPDKYHSPTLQLSPIGEPDMPQAYRRRPTEVLAPPDPIPVLPEDSSEIKVKVFFRKPSEP